MTKSRRAAIAIVDRVEDLLEQHNIVIPNEDRPEGNGVPLYGCTWGNLVDEIEEVCRQYGIEEKN